MPQGFYHPIGGKGLPFGTDATIVVLTRDAFTWLSKMFEECKFQDV